MIVKIPKKSILALTIFFLWIAFSIASFTFYTTSINSFAEQDFQFKQTNVDYQLETASELLLNDQTGLMIDRLERAKDLQQINFYFLHKAKNRQPAEKEFPYELLNKNKEEIATKQKVIYDWALATFDKTDWNEDTDKMIRWKTRTIMNYKLTVGFFTDKVGYIQYKLNQNKFILIFQQICVTLIAFIVIFFLIKDLRLLKKQIENNNLNFDNIKTISSESESILRATKTLVQSSHILQTTNETFAGTITPAVLNEIKNKTQTPHTFFATLVRVDLNGYTRLFLEKKPGYITEVLNHYFKRSREIIERYDGLIYQFVGDEIVFFIKDPADKNPSDGALISKQKALMCVRSLFLVADEIEEKFAKTAGHKFKIKSSFAHGPITFNQLDQGYAFSGLPLIESVRMIGTFQENDENSLSIYKSDFTLLNNFASESESKVAPFKGFKEEQEITLVKKFVSLEHCLDTQPFSNFGSLFRYDSDLVLILKKMAFHIQHRNKDAFFVIFSDLRSLRIETADAKLIHKYIEILRNTITDYQMHNEKKEFISAIISLAYNLVPAQLFNEELYKLLEEALQLDDVRTQANALATLAEFDPNSPRYKGYMNSKSHRLAANALLIEMKKEITGEIKKVAFNFLDSENPFFVASGLYAIEQAFNHHQVHNRIYYESSSVFQEIRNRCEKHLKSTNEMVQKRAQKIPGLSVEVQDAA